MRSIAFPASDGEDHQTRIDARETKSPPRANTVRWLAASTRCAFGSARHDYKHNEIGLADPADLSTLGVRQTFTNKEQEGRVEVQLMPFNLRFATLTTALGCRPDIRNLTAPSPDNAGLWDPNNNHRVAGYIFNEFQFSDWTKAQVAGRIERVNLHGSPRPSPAISFPFPAPTTS